MANELVNDAIRDLYEEFERLSEIHDELMDTDVRESLHLTLNYFFVWGKAVDRIPVSYGMFSMEGDRAVENAVNRFLTSICATLELRQVPVGKDRLLLLQNPELSTLGGCQYDDFIGHSDVPLPPDDLPEDLFDIGYYDD